MPWYDELAGALTYPAHEIARGARFMGGLSARDNREMQAQFMAKDLRARGIPGQTAWPAAHQYATDQNIHYAAQRDQAVQALAQLLRAQAFHHRP